MSDQAADAEGSGGSSAMPAEGTNTAPIWSATGLPGFLARRRGGIALLRRECARWMSVWVQTLGPPVISALIFLVIFVVVLGDRLGENGQKEAYAAFMAPGLVMMSVVNAAFSNSSSSIFQHRNHGSIQPIMSAPIPPLDLAFGMIGGSAVRALAVGVLVWIACGWWAGFWPANIVAALVFMLLVGAAFGAIGVIFGLAAQRWDHIALMNTFILTPLTFLGGVFFSVDQLGAGWARALASANPVLYLVNGLRGAWHGSGASETNMWLNWGIGVVSAVVLCWWAAHGLERGWRVRT